MVFLLYTAAFCLFITTVLLYVDKRRKHKRLLFKKLERSDFAESGTQWTNAQHEYHVERFYETGLTGKHDFHGGYLNFGYWVDGNKDYIKASEALLSQVADPVSIGRESRLLDVANGTGMQDIFFYNKYKPKQIDTIDVTLSHCLICQKRIKEHGLGECIKAHYGSAVHLPFEDNSFTHVISVEGGIHYHTRRDFILEGFRVLEPNGWLSLADYIMRRPPTSIIEKTISWFCGKAWNAPTENFWDAKTFKERMEEAGFVDVVLKDIGDSCIPGYYAEATRPETKAELSKVRGWFAAYVTGWLIDEMIRYVYEKGILSEAIAYGRKPRKSEKLASDCNPTNGQISHNNN